jgi:DNA-binding GntR family transcriptional regulator
LLTNQLFSGALDDESSARLANRIGEEIVHGVLASGQKLNEVALAERFEVSRGPIREALRRLAERRLVVFTSNAGARVATYSLEDMINLMVVREALEGLAARLATEHMSPEQKTELAAVVSAQASSVEAYPDGYFLQAPEDLDFHYLIAQGSRNPNLVALLCDDLYLVLRLCRNQNRKVTNRGRRAFEEHRRILTAIEEGDAELAELCMRRHIAAARQSILSASPELP